MEVVTTQTSSYHKQQLNQLTRYGQEVCEGHANLHLRGRFVFRSGALQYSVDVQYAGIGMPFGNTDAIIVIYSGVTEACFGIGLYTPATRACRELSPKQAIKLMTSGKKAGIENADLNASLRINMMFDLLGEVFCSTVSTDTDDGHSTVSQGA